MANDSSSDSEEISFRGENKIQTLIEEQYKSVKLRLWVKPYPQLKSAVQKQLKFARNESQLFLCLFMFRLQIVNFLHQKLKRV